MSYDLHGKRVYLSGPMSGIEDLNAKAFAQARFVCMQLGAREAFNPVTAWGHVDRDKGWYMRNDLHRLTLSYGNRPYYDYLVLLDGCEMSEGSLLESAVAAASGIPVIDVCDLRKQLKESEVL